MECSLNARAFGLDGSSNLVSSPLPCDFGLWWLVAGRLLGVDDDFLLCCTSGSEYFRGFGGILQCGRIVFSCGSSSGMLLFLLMATISPSRESSQLPEVSREEVLVANCLILSVESRPPK